MGASKVVRICNNCDAWFQKETDEESLYFIRQHLEVCEEDKPYLDDPNADGYEYF